MQKLRYTLHYIHRRGEPWMDNFRVTREKLDCKTLKEANSYAELLTEGEKKGAYILDNVTNIKIEVK